MQVYKKLIKMQLQKICDAVILNKEADLLRLLCTAILVFFIFNSHRGQQQRLLVKHPNIHPDLKTDEEAKEGIDYDEVIAPVPELKPIRIFLAFCLLLGFITTHHKNSINWSKKVLSLWLNAEMSCVSTTRELGGNHGDWQEEIKEFVSKQGMKSAKAEPSVHKDPLFDELPEDTLDYMETEDAQDVGRIREVVNEEKETVNDEVSTEYVLSTAKQNVRRRATPTTPTTTPTMFGDDETIAQVLLNMSQAKAVSREKEKGVELKDV
ncbi:hypothetical protein Tco_1245300 [Tanacetum coccineum]